LPRGKTWGNRKKKKTFKKGRLLVALKTFKEREGGKDPSLADDWEGGKDCFSRGGDRGR